MEETLELLLYYSELLGDAMVRDAQNHYQLNKIKSETDALIEHLQDNLIVQR